MIEFKISPSPFANPKDNPKVFVAGKEGGYQNTINALENIDLSPARGKRVLLKPNAGRLAHPGSGINTNPEVMEATIDAFVEAGADVHIGESPITGVDTLEAFEVTGIADVARRKGIPLIDMDKRKFVHVKVDGIAIQELKVCPEVLEFDIIVSVAVMKTHMHTDVTLGVKNMKGCLWRRSKVVLHMLAEIDGYDEKPLNIAIADMSEHLRPHLTIIDGQWGMEGIGPSAGQPKSLDCVVVGVDPFAADAVACRLMGRKAEEVPHLRIGAERGFGVIEMGRINVSPADYMQYHSTFDKPPTDISIGFPEFNILDENSCSACQSSLLLFLKRYGDTVLEYTPDGEDIFLAIGKGLETVPAGTWLIGNCTRNCREQGKFLKGCPPVGSEILRFITGSPIIDEKDAKGE